MKKIYNKETIAGRVYEHNLAIKKVQNTDSENYGKDFIGGSLDIATDEDCLNVITVEFTYVTPFTKSGTANSTYNALKKIIEDGKTVLIDGKDAATLVSISTAIGLKDFYTNRNGKEELVSAKKNDGGFVTIIDKLPREDNKRNSFEIDMLINGTKYVEADPEKNIENDYLIVKGAAFNFRNAILPVEFVVKDPMGMKYFESLDASPSNLIFTKVYGVINSETIVRRIEEESAFGEPVVKEYTRSIKEWVITNAAKEPYPTDDAEAGITLEEVKKAMEDRNVYLAEVKRRQDEYQATKASSVANTSAIGTTAASGAFNF